MAALITTILGTQPSALKAYYKLNETVGSTLADSSGNGQNLTINAGITLNQSGASGPAILCDGATGNATRNANIFGGNVPSSMTFWMLVKGASNSGEHGILSFASSSVTTVTLRVHQSTAKIGGYYRQSDATDQLYQDESDTTIFNGATWHSICLKLVSNIWHLYIDGVENTSGGFPHTQENGAAATVTDMIAIGCRQGRFAQDEFYGGYIQHVAIWNTALSDGERTAIESALHPGGISTAPKLWLKADAGAYKDAGSTLAADGESVQQWNDQGIGANHATQATSGQRPVYKTNIVNGQPVLRFSAASSRSLALPNFASAFTQGEVFVVVKLNTDPPNPSPPQGGLMDFGTTSNPTIFPFGGDGIIYDGTGSDSRKVTGAPAISLAQWVIYNVTTRAGEWTSRLLGSTHFTTATNTCEFRTNPLIGASSNGAFFLDGDMAELIVFDTALSGGTDRTDVYNYLHTKYFPAIDSVSSASSVSDVTSVSSASSNSSSHSSASSASSHSSASSASSASSHSSSSSSDDSSEDDIFDELNRVNRIAAPRPHPAMATIMIERAGGQLIEVLDHEPDAATYRNEYYYNAYLNVLFRKKWQVRRPKDGILLAAWQPVSQ